MGIIEHMKMKMQTTYYEDQKRAEGNTGKCMWFCGCDRLQETVFEDPNHTKQNGDAKKS